VWSLALTWRPLNGLTDRHERLLHKFLDKWAAQWDIYEECVNDDPATRHVHGRILLKKEHRMDKIKCHLATSLNAVLSEKKVLLRGIKWLYDDWEYASKDGTVWDTHLTDEDAWVYADPANKYERKKNAEILHWIELIRADLPEDGMIAGETVQHYIMHHIIAGEIEMPMPTTLTQKCNRLALYWKYYCHREEE
jgi:hypothetical protein